MFALCQGTEGQIRNVMDKFFVIFEQYKRPCRMFLI